MNKVCKKCVIEQPIENFSKGAKMKDGHLNICKNCRKKYNVVNAVAIKKQRQEFYKNNRNRILTKVLEYSKINREEKNEYAKNYYHSNKKMLAVKSTKYYKDNKESFAIKAKQYRETKKEELTNYSKKYRESNKQKIKEQKAKSYALNKDKVLKRVKKYRQENKEKITAKLKEKRQNNPLLKLKHNTRGMITKIIQRNGYEKNTKTANILGCSFEEFKIKIEGEFKKWMNWENYGKYNGELNYGWDLDHIVPLCTAKDEGELLKLNHYTNLQPLCSKVNRDIKRGRV